MLKKRDWLIYILLFTLLSSDVLAEDEGGKEWLNWQDTSITLLYGGGFKVDPSDQITGTFEYANDWRYGDTFIFVDSTHYTNGKTNSDGDRNSWYGEIQPRLSASKITGSNIGFGFIKDVLLASTYERGKDRDATESLLLGIGLDVDVNSLGFGDLDGWRYLQLNLYMRNDFADESTGFQDYQLTVVTAVAFEIGKSKFLVDGYLDYVIGNKVRYPNFHLNPQVKLDLGNYYAKPNKLFFGLEVDYWTNKYGIKDSSEFETDQFTASALIKYHF